MAKEEEKRGSTGKVCLFDLDHEVLEQILGNKKIHGLLEGNDSSFLGDSEVFLELTGESSLYLVSGPLEEAKKEWTYELPVEVIEAINKIVAETPQKELASGVGEL